MEAKELADLLSALAEAIRREHTDAASVLLSLAGAIVIGPEAVDELWNVVEGCSRRWLEITEPGRN